VLILLSMDCLIFLNSLSPSPQMICINVQILSHDLESSFIDEFMQFTNILVVDNDKTITHKSELLKSDGGIMLSMFNVAFTLIIYPTLPINNCQGETSFSTLTRVKNHLQSTMGQDRFAALSFLCIKSDLLRQLDCTQLIDDFAQLKCRRRDFQNMNCRLLCRDPRG
jgi:hypothetical protein